MGRTWLAVPRELIETLGDVTRFMGRVVAEVASLKVLRFTGETLRQAGILILGSALVIWGLAFILGLTCGIEGAYFSRSVGAPVGTAAAKSMVLNTVIVHLIGMIGTQIFWGTNPRAPIGG